MGNDLCDRLFKFAAEVIKLLRKIKYSHETGIIKYQLTKSATSSGAHYSPGQIA